MALMTPASAGVLQSDKAGNGEVVIQTSSIKDHTCDCCEV